MSQAGIISTSSGPVPPNVPTSFLLDDGNSAVPSANVIQVHGVGGATTSLGNSNEININIINDGFPWSEKAISFDANVQNGYFCTAALTVSLPINATFPSPLVLGNTIIIVVDTASTVTIQAAVGDSIQISQNISVAGGTAVSNTRGSVLELIYRPSDLTWHTISSIGVWAVT